MKWSQLVWLAFLVAVLVAYRVHPVHAQFKDLARHVPSTANALVLFNLERLHQSPIAVREGWEQEHEKAFAAGLVVVPSDAKRLVLASQVDFELLEPIWDVAVLELDEIPPMATVAREYQGRADTVGGVPAAALPGDLYLVQLDSGTLGAMSPANRQNVARWVRDCRSKTSVNLPPYLQEALGYADVVGTEIIMALDLSDVLTPHIVREEIGLSRTLEGRNIDVDALASVLSSLRGVTLGIRTGEKPFGKIKVDFGFDASIMAEFAKPLLLETLADGGARIDDFYDWQAEVDEKQITIEGYLSSSGMRRIFSVLEAPTTSLGGSAAEPTSETPSGTIAKAQASLRHFRSVKSLLDDFEGSHGDTRTYGQIGLWFEKYARKIDSLPVLNVDSELLDYSAHVAELLRNAAIAIQGAGIRSVAREAGIHGYVARGWAGAHRGPVHYSTRNVAARRRAVAAQERATGASSVIGIMREIETATSKIRRAMTERYQIEF